MITEKHNHLVNELGDDLMHTPLGKLPQQSQQEILWHLQADDFAGAKRVRDRYERQQRLKAAYGKLQRRYSSVLHD